ncbi:hypothetical protein [Gordonia sp. (in: high G+C Gram-positive bacteria)]|uniref:hypothetical protein n=1 Tax=Gordonia sp. (in: high G+C Gram-positive bacteria) TaxID=84139 RepID=UPI0039E6FD24
MKRRLSIAVVSAAAGLSLGALAIAPASAATPQHGPDAQTTGLTICWHGPNLGSVSIGYCF